MQQRFQEELTQYEEDGYAIFEDVIDSDLVNEARRHIDWLLQRNPGVRPEQLHHTLMSDDPFWVRLISDDRLLDVAAGFVGPDIALFASHYIAKRPFDGQSVLWHQDGTYWPLEPMRVVTLWLALDHSEPENGCMRVIPGTHRRKLVKEDEMENTEDDSNVLGSGLKLDEADLANAVDVILKPGDVSVHHPNLVHGSAGNHSNRWRRGLTIRYIPASTQITSDEPWPSAFMLRGQPEEEVNSYRPLPKYSADRHMDFSGAEEWNEYCSLHNDRYSEVIS